MQKVAVIRNSQVVGVFRTFVVGAIGLDSEFGIAKQSVVLVQFGVPGSGVSEVVVVVVLFERIMKRWPGSGV